MKLPVLCSVGCACAALICSSLAGAQASGGASATHTAAHATAVLIASGDSAEPQLFQITAKPLLEALADFSRQAGVRVAIQGAGLADFTVKPLAGTFTPTEALRRLLDGSGLTARFIDASTVVVHTATETATPGSGAHPLHRVIVRGVQTRSKSYALRRTSTAARTDTPLLDTPQAVTVITSELITDQAMQSLGDVVRYVPGIIMGLGEGHRDQPTIRGNNTTADFFLDGVRDDAQFYRDLYNVDRVEALKGPNAMIFGRGGGGGVINRVLKEAHWTPTRAITLQGGSFDHRRAALDLGDANGRAAGRVNAMAERSGGFRDAAHLEREGINPTLALTVGASGTARFGYEYFRDERRVDRGIPAFDGRPSPAAISTFFGNPGLNEARALVRTLSAAFDHVTAGGVGLRNRTQFADYDKFYRNTLPAAVNTVGTEVTLTAYSHGMRRHNVFNQTDVTRDLATGPVRHTLLAGAELGRQRTDQVRNTGYFNDVATSFVAPFESPTINAPVTFRPSATDPNSASNATTVAVYVQDQIAVTPRLRAVLGVRRERFALKHHDNRTGSDLARTDNLLSPRFGVVLKPAPNLSLYGSHSLSYLPSAGDQFLSLSPSTQTLEPERFTNREVGLKWDVRPELALTSSLYRLDRINTTAPDPNDPTHVVQTGGQRTSGFELGVTGTVNPKWEVSGGYSAQHARITSTTTAAATGAVVPLVPERTLTLWNRYSIGNGLGLGLGVMHQSAMYAAIDNKVRLPEFTRVDAALYLPLFPHIRAQLNVENLLDERYYPTSHGNNNIMPGAPRTLLLSIVTGL